MSKFYSNTASIYSLISELKTAELKPVYFLFGDDYLTINNAVKAISMSTEPLISSDFDRETISAEKIISNRYNGSSLYVPFWIRKKNTNC